jgi:hypothetical protein
LAPILALELGDSGSQIDRPRGGQGLLVVRRHEVGDIAGRTPAGAGVRTLFDATLVLSAGTEDRAFGRDVEAVRTVVRNFRRRESSWLI